MVWATCDILQVEGVANISEMINDIQLATLLSIPGMAPNKREQWCQQRFDWVLRKCAAYSGLNWTCQATGYSFLPYYGGY